MDLKVGPAKWVDPHTVVAEGPAPDPVRLAQMEASFRDFGQLTPVLITAQGVLLTGAYRLHAARSLGTRLLAREVAGSLEALEALKREDNFVRVARLGHLAGCLHTYALDVWYADRGERAGRGRSAGLTVGDIAERRRIGERTAARHLQIARGLLPAVRDVLVVQPDAATWSLDELDRFSRLAPTTQEDLAARLDDEGFSVLLDAVSPRTEAPGPSTADAQVARLAAFAEVARTLGGPWTGWGAEAASLQARIEAWLASEASSVAGAAGGGGSTGTSPEGAAPPASASEAEDASSPPAEDGSSGAGADVAPAAEEDVAADDEAAAPEVLAPAASPAEGEDGARSGRRPVDAVRDALPDVEAALAAGQAALDRARRTGHRPASVAVTLDAAAARVAAVVAPAMGVDRDGSAFSGPGDAVDVVRLLGETLASRMRGRGALGRLQGLVDGLPRPGDTPR